jgi:hypothetical protein
VIRTVEDYRFFRKFDSDFHQSFGVYSSKDSVIDDDVIRWIHSRRCGVHMPEVEVLLPLAQYSIPRQGKHRCHPARLMLPV